MKLPEQALSILTQYMLPLLSHGAILDQGRLLSCYAKCQVAMAANKGEVERRKGKQWFTLIHILFTVLLWNNHL